MNTGTSGQFISQRCAFLSLCFFTVCVFVSPLSVSLTTITYFAAFVLLLMSGDWRARISSIKNNNAALSFFLMSVVVIFGVFYSTSTTHFILKDLSKRYWIFLTPFFIAMSIDDHWRRRMTNAFLAAMTITLILSTLKWFTHMNVVAWIPYAKEKTSASIFMYHIAQGFAMNMAAFICAYRFLFEKRNRVYYAIIFLCMAINIVYISSGRTGYGIFFLLLFYSGAVRFGWKGVWSTLFLSAVMILAAFFISNGFHTRMKAAYENTVHYSQIHKIDPSQHSIGQRIEMWYIAKKMIRERPWFGYGTGGISTEMVKVVPAKDRVFNSDISYVESIYLNFILEFGIFGFIVFLIAIAMQIRVSFQLPHEYRYLAQILLIAVLFGGFFNSFFIAFSVAHFYALFSAICFSALPSKR